MPKISSYALQYIDAQFDALQKSGYDLLILQQENIKLTQKQLKTLTSQGKICTAYVNSSVTDHYMDYWQKSWTDNGLDTGKAIKGVAPKWLLNQPSNSFGIVADYSHSDWHKIVIDQAIAHIEQGYNGIFLDDLSSAYFLYANKKGSIKRMSAAMINLVIALKKTMTKVNPRAFLVVNGDPYLVANVGGISTYEAKQFLQHIDAMLLESQYGSGVYKVALETIAPSAQLLALEFNKTNAEAKAFKITANSHNILPYLSPTDAYNTLVPLEKQGFLKKIFK